MANRPLGLRVPDAERPAWKRVLAQVRAIGPLEAERRLAFGPPDGSPGDTSARALAPVQAEREHTWPEQRLLAALGHRGEALRSEAIAWLVAHGLPATPENRTAALLDALARAVRDATAALQAAEEERDAVEGEAAAWRQAAKKARAEHAGLRGELRTGGQAAEAPGVYRLRDARGNPVRVVDVLPAPRQRQRQGRAARGSQA